MEIDLETNTKSKTQKPKQYLVKAINDDFTTFEVVMTVLVTHFNKSLEDARHLTAEIHVKGEAIVGGPFTLEIAEEKIQRSMDFAKRYEYPLTLIPVEG